jgi:regulation of enolase protein 1 (concanavalin A-like superfamily)
MHLCARVCRISAALIGSLFAFASAVSAQSLPAPWVDRDIGGPSIAGDATYSSPTFTITAGGSDIWGTSDQFHFVYQPITGDIDVRARVDDVVPASVWSKAGVMIRASLNSGSAHGFALVSASKGLAFQRRRSSGAGSVSTGGEFASAPRWVRLVRSGTLVTAYSSADGVSWTKIGSDTIQLGATAYVGIAATSHNQSVSTTAKVSQMSVTQVGALPNGQKDSDIGSPALNGSASYNNGIYTITAAGADIWGTSDQFHFVYQQMSGDLDVKVRVASISYADRWSKAGVMIRQSLSASSAHAFALTSARRGYAFQRRDYTGGLSADTAGSAAGPPGWVRLTRSGNLVTAYQSTDGVNWTKIGSDSVELTDPVYVGIAATSHDTSATTTVTADHFSAQVTSQTNQPPSVTLATAGTSFTAPATISLTATASDPENQLARVEFYDGSTLLSTDTTSPYSFSWTNVSAGSYSLTAVAYDAQGASATSAAVSVQVTSQTNQPPTVTLATNGASFSAPATIALTATASDPENQLARVQFYSGSTLLSTDTTAPYSFSWTNVPAGTYSVTAVAVDAQGASTRSAPVAIVVSTVTSSNIYLAFTTTAQDESLATGYVVEVFSATANVSTATPLATQSIGKPTLDSSGNAQVDITTLYNGLAVGNYQMAVRVDSSAGSATSVPIAFTR